MLALVSSPPVKTPSARPARSKSLIASPCSRMMSPIRPSPGVASAAGAVASMRKPRDSETAPKVPCPPWLTSKRAEPSWRKVSRSSSGSPSSSQITWNGTGNANSGTRSTTGPRGLPARRAARSTIRVDQRTEPVEPAHRELGGEQPAQPRVLGRVGEPEPADVAAVGRTPGAHERPDVVAEVAVGRPAPRGPRRARSPSTPSGRGTRSAGAPAPRPGRSPSRVTGSTPSRCSGHVSRSGTRSSRVRSMPDLPAQGQEAATGLRPQERRHA